MAPASSYWNASFLKVGIFFSSQERTAIEKAFPMKRKTLLLIFNVVQTIKAILENGKKKRKRQSPVKIVCRKSSDYHFSDMPTVIAVSKGNLIPAGERISDLNVSRLPFNTTLEHLYI